MNIKISSDSTLDLSPELIKKYDPDSKVVMISAAGQREKMFKAIKYGAAEFITKPYEKNEVEKIIKGLID